MLNRGETHASARHTSTMAAHHTECEKKTMGEQQMPLSLGNARQIVEQASDEAIKHAERKRLMAHQDLVRLERSEYNSRRDQGIRRPSKFLNVIIDGADQAQYVLPRGHTHEGIDHLLSHGRVQATEEA